jgi:hypothetical protein
VPDGGDPVTEPTSQLSLLAGRDSESAALVNRLLDLAQRILPQMYLDGEFVFTLNGTRRYHRSRFAAAP